MHHPFQLWIGDTPSRRAVAREAGFSLIDSLISMVVISLSCFGFLAATISSSALERENRTVAAANEISRRVMEQMMALPLSEVLARYNSDPADDPDGPNTAKGDTFQMRTSERCQNIDAARYAEESVPNEMTCRITVPTTANGAGVKQLREDSIAPRFGLPADLNGDRVIDAVDHSADYRFLPVSIRIDWPTPDGGLRSVNYTVVLGDRVTP